MQIGDWRWLDLGNVPGVLDWVAFILGTIGMAVALVQLFKSRGALAAAKQALDDARRGLVRDQLLQVLPRFTEISASLDDAIRADSRELAQKALGVSAVIGVLMLIAVLLAIACVIFLIYFIVHIAQSISMSHVVHVVAEDVEDHMRRLIQLGEQEKEAKAPGPEFYEAAEKRRSSETGYLKFVDYDAIAQAAAQAGGGRRPQTARARGAARRRRRGAPPSAATLACASAGR